MQRDEDRRCRRHRRGRCRCGLTLIEVAVALLLLSVGALALAAGVTIGERARLEAVHHGLALAAAETWLETWRSSPWPAEGAGVTPVEWAAWDGQLEWRATAISPCLAEARVAAGGAAWPGTVVLVSRRFREGATDCDR